MRRLDKKQIKKQSKALKRNQQIYLLLENIQYATNVASSFRTADAAGVKKIFLTGISKQPPFGKDLRKTSRSKERSVHWEYVQESATVIRKLKQRGFTIVAIELAEGAIPLHKLYETMQEHENICFVAGSEVYGVTNSTLDLCDYAVQVPMYGKGASLNVSVATAVVLFSL